MLSKDCSTYDDGEGITAFCNIHDAAPDAIKVLEELVEFAAEKTGHDEDYGHLMSDEPDECCICKAYKVIRDA